MPVEEQWTRVNTPLRRRDKRFLVVMACILGLALAGGIVAYATRPPGASNVGCVVVTVPSTMGGAILRNCDGAAKAFCRDHPDAGNAAEQCRRLGYPTGHGRA